MTESYIRVLLNKSLRKLYNLDKELLEQKFNINERTVMHRLAVYIEEEFPDYDVDCEYNRMVDPTGNITDGDYWAKTINLEVDEFISGEDDEAKTVFPDIIIHRRRQPVNYVVIELKVKWKNSLKAFDLRKLSAYKKDLHYQFAILIEIDENEFSLSFV
jgi:hypothetical protein